MMDRFRFLVINIIRQRGGEQQDTTQSSINLKTQGHSLPKMNVQYDFEYLYNNGYHVNEFTHFKVWWNIY